MAQSQRFKPASFVIFVPTVNEKTGKDEWKPIKAGGVPGAPKKFKDEGHEDQMQRRPCSKCTILTWHRSSKPNKVGQRDWRCTKCMPTRQAKRLKDHADMASPAFGSRR